MSGDTVEGEDPSAGVAERMADAILYLSAVAKKAGLEAISDDLLSIRKKLKEGAVPGAQREDARSPAANSRNSYGARQ